MGHARKTFIANLLTERRAENERVCGCLHITDNDATETTSKPVAQCLVGYASPIAICTDCKKKKVRSQHKGEKDGRMGNGGDKC